MHAYVGKLSKWPLYYYFITYMHMYASLILDVFFGLIYKAMGSLHIQLAAYMHM